MSEKPLTFVLSDESVNRNGFRVITLGIELDNFRNNPVMLWVHKRDNKYNDFAMLPIGIWKNIRIDNNKLLAEAEFDEDDELAMRIKTKVEKGHLRMASAGLCPITWSEDSKLMLPGQTNPTLLKCEILEASIVDIGSNQNAIRLYKDGGLVELSAVPKLLNQTKIEIKIMEKLNKLLQLAADATDEKVYDAVQAILNRNQQLATDLSAKDQTIAQLNVQIGDFKKKKVVDLVSQAIADKRIDETMRQEYIELASENYERCEKILNSMPKVGNVNQQLNNQQSESKDLNWDTLHKEGKLETLKAEKPDVFKALYKQKFGKEYKG